MDLRWTSTTKCTRCARQLCRDAPTTVRGKWPSSKDGDKPGTTPQRIAGHRCSVTSMGPTATPPCPPKTSRVLREWLQRRLHVRVAGLSVSPASFTKFDWDFRRVGNFAGSVIIGGRRRAPAVCMCANGRGVQAKAQPSSMHKRAGGSRRYLPCDQTLGKVGCGSSRPA